MTATQTRPTTQRESHGLVRWLVQPTMAELDAGNAVLRIAADGRPAQTYRVRRLTENGRTVGYTLTSGSVVYEVDCTFGGLAYSLCDCPASGWRRGPYLCKHRKALVSLAAAGKL